MQSNRERADFNYGAVSNPNLLINGDFSVNQRENNTFTSVHQGVYAVDRWCLTVVKSGVAHLNFKSTVYENLGFGLDYDQDALWEIELNDATTDFMSVGQRIERAALASFKVGDDVTFKLKFAQQGFNVSTSAVSFGTSVPTVKDNYAEWDAVTLKTQPLKGNNIEDSGEITFKITKEMLDRGLMVHVSIRSETAPFSDGTAKLQMFSAKLEEGDIATKFIPDLPSVNLTKCLPFFETGSFNTNYYGHYGTGIVFRGRKRTTPTIVLFETLIGSGVLTPMHSDVVTVGNFRPVITNSPPATAIGGGQFKADAEL